MSLVYLDELCDSISETFDKSTENIVLINTSDVYNGKVLNHEFVPNKNIKGQFKKLFRKNDILYSEIRPANKHYAFVDFESKNYVASTKLMVLRPKIDIVRPKFLYYILKNKDVVNFLQGLAESRSGTFPQITFSELSTIDINLPSLEEQDVIVDIINNIESKIENLNKINKNLEEQIETVYNSFFVYYDDFSKEELEECEIGLIPKEWNLLTLGEVTTQIKQKVGNDDYKVFSAVNTGNLILSEEYFDKQVFSKSIEKYIVVKQKEFAYNPARVNIGSIGRNDFDYDGCVSPVYVAFKVEEGYENFMNMFIKSNRFNQWVITLASGSVRQTLNYSDFSIIKIAYPPKDLIEKFNIIYESYYEVINHNNSMINNLENIRDILLPKLMSGEIDVSKINCDMQQISTNNWDNKFTVPLQNNLITVIS